MGCVLGKGVLPQMVRKWLPSISHTHTHHTLSLSLSPIIPSPTGDQPAFSAQAACGCNSILGSQSHHSHRVGGEGEEGTGQGGAGGKRCGAVGGAQLYRPLAVGPWANRLTPVSALPRLDREAILQGCFSTRGQRALWETKDPRSSVHHQQSTHSSQMPWAACGTFIHP